MLLTTLSPLGRICGARAQLARGPHHPFQGQHSRSTSTAAHALTYQRPLIVPPTAPHTATVLMLHGLGDSGNGWYGIGPEFSQTLPHVKFMFPNAPQRPISLNFGMKMPGWYDIASLQDINQREDSEGLHESFRYIEDFIKAEAAAGVPSERVVVAGFSQGGAIALMMLRSKHKLAAVVGLSTYVPLRNEGPLVSDANKATPVLMCHGDADQVVAYEYGQETSSRLQALGADVTFITYRGMGHTATPQELKDFQEFLLQHIA